MGVGWISLRRYEKQLGSWTITKILKKSSRKFQKISILIKWIIKIPKYSIQKSTAQKIIRFEKENKKHRISKIILSTTHSILLTSRSPQSQESQSSQLHSPFSHLKTIQDSQFAITPTLRSTIAQTHTNTNISRPVKMAANWDVI